VLRARIESIGVSPPGNGLHRGGSLAHATRAGKACLEASCYAPHDVEVLINAGVHRDRHYAEPAFACFIQKEIGVNVEFQGRQTLAFDLLNGGCGLLNAMHVLATMLQTGAHRIGMAIASEINTDRKPEPSAAIIPSGAAALIDVSPYATRGFGRFVFETFDQHSELYGSHVSLAQKHGRLFMRKQEALETIYLELVPQVWRRLLGEEGLAPKAIDLVIPSQISAGFLQRLPDVLGLPRERVLDLSAELGDTLSTSVLLALEQARRSGRIDTGARVVLLTVGSGITVGAATYQL